MSNQRALQEALQRIDGKSYNAYKDIKGSYKFKDYMLIIEHVQGDPFAGPSKICVKMAHQVHGIPQNLWDTHDKRIAVADFLTRCFRANIFKIYEGTSGSGKSGLMVIDDCGQQMLERTSVVIDEKNIVVNFYVGLPAAGRRILGKAAIEIFCEALPKIVTQSLLYKNIDAKALKSQVELMLDQQYIRGELKQRGLVAFVANGAILPRESGISDKPLGKGAVAFKSPEHLEVIFELPYKGKLKGMGIPKGITLIVGGGYHGKSTLLKALELGVYNHILKDGREYVITDCDAVKVRAEDGRSIACVDISSFINNLPNHKDTVRFETQNASGSTSQAANTMEALETGTSCLLIDEDTSATNFMIRDRRMQQLVAPDKEPITPFIDKVKQLYVQHGVSTILVVGGSGEYFDVADLVIMMDEYVPKDVTQQAHEIAKSDTQHRIRTEQSFGTLPSRTPLKMSIAGNEREQRIKLRNQTCISVGKSNIELDFVEQLVDYNQTTCIAVFIEYLMKHAFGNGETLSETINKLYGRIEKEGMMSILSGIKPAGNLALPRKQELYAAINRYRLLKIKL